MLSTTRKTALRAGSVLVGAVAIVTAVSTVAGAATFTYTVSVGTNTTAKATLTAASSSSVVFTDETSGLTTTCSSASTSEKSQLGTASSGKPIARITASSFNGCIAAGQLPLNVVQNGVWVINASGATNKSGVTKATIAQVNSSVTSSVSNCAFTVSGGVNATYSNTTHTLTVAPTANNPKLLTVSNQSGNCFGLVANGDKVSLKTTFSVTATSPSGAFTVKSN